MRRILDLIIKNILVESRFIFKDMLLILFKLRKKKTLLFRKIKQKRLEILQNIDQAKLSEKSKEFTKGIILADRTEMDEKR